MPPRIITLVRHGQAEHNVSRDFQVRGTSLTALGETQCQELSKTTLLGFKKRVESGVKVKFLAELQETSDMPSDTGSSRDVLEKEELFQGLDFSGLPDDWTSKKGKWAPDPDSLRERARIVRKWLKSRSEDHVVAVSHGYKLGIATATSRALAGAKPSSGSYAFVEGDDDNASIIETDESKERRKEGKKPVGETEMKPLGEVVRN
ncbi:hypothetical protein B9Z19DRAFT_1131019 [Tuber borchii]|uniref:Histidine phosphatase superfamily n=1 Tax=Tuber borchii TaxID=42251 RepID=A0A2T6ZJI9_TUBBO|nr:hypothetical protein B9Z19DRAFT_1131019 [Tuber borchii]